MTVAENLRKICAAARPAIEAALDAAEELSEIREAASEQGLDWSQVKALLKAQIQDERDGGERVKKLVAKAENAAAYAVMLEKPAYVEGPNVVEKKKTLPQSIAASTSSPPTRGDEAVKRVPSGAASPISEAAPALGVVGGKGTDAASSHSAVSTQQVTSLPDGGNLAGSNAGHLLFASDAISPTAPHPMLKPTSDTDPSLDIMTQPFYRGGETWPR